MSFDAYRMISIVFSLVSINEDPFPNQLKAGSGCLKTSLTGETRLKSAAGKEALIYPLAKVHGCEVRASFDCGVHSYILRCLLVQFLILPQYVTSLVTSLLRFRSTPLLSISPVLHRSTVRSLFFTITAVYSAALVSVKENR
jgi:hypothetical protein